MAEAVRQHEVSALELVDAHLSAIERDNPRINAFIEIYASEARERARAPLHGPLAGVPVTVKDSFDIAGHVTNCGSLLRRGIVAERDSTVAERLQNAGAIILGKTSAPEFLYNYETDNRLIGPTNHPWDATRTPGGSSGGEAAAIAGFLSAGGVGSDGGGSIREPAHFCGICGLKPTPGRVPAGGHWPEIAHPTGFMGVAGPMARSVQDTRLLFETLAGHDVRDPFSVPIALRPASLEGLRVAVMDQLPVRPACAAAVHHAATLLNAEGFSTIPFPFELIEGAHELWRLFFIDLLTPGVRAFIAGREDECSWTGLQLMQYVREEITTARLSECLLQRDRMRACLLQWMGERTVIAAPAFGVTAFPHRERDFELMDAVRPLTPWNLLGMPALVVPMLTGEDGMPAGVQLIGAPYAEELLLQLGERLEDARGSSWQNQTFSPSITNSTISTTV
jgi:Asp-tRNA(Asn)/Glu-tRNA(Gln) amidotransferase A subunit family amidase